jgi:quinol monooxygenase YgiN
MLVIAGHFRIDPAKRADAVAAATWMMEETRREPGCGAYTFSADLADPGVVYLFEVWDSPAALEAHVRSPHMKRFQGVVGGLGVKEMKIQRYEVSSVGPLR